MHELGLPISSSHIQLLGGATRSGPRLQVQDLRLPISGVYSGPRARVHAGLQPHGEIENHAKILRLRPPDRAQNAPKSRLLDTIRKPFFFRIRFRVFLHGFPIFLRKLNLDFAGPACDLEYFSFFVLLILEDTFPYILVPQQLPKPCKIK